MARELNVFETSSPSYPLMASIQLCVDWLEREGPAAREAFSRRLEKLDRLKLAHLKIFCHGEDGLHGFFGHDPGKLLVRGGCAGPGWPGSSGRGGWSRRWSPPAASSL